MSAADGWEGGGGSIHLAGLLSPGHPAPQAVVDVQQLLLEVGIHLPDGDLAAPGGRHAGLDERVSGGMGSP